MIRRFVQIPARYLPALDAALEKMRHQIEAGEIPEWATDDYPPEVMLSVTIERPEPVLTLRRVG